MDGSSGKAAFALRRACMALSSCPRLVRAGKREPTGGFFGATALRQFRALTASLFLPVAINALRANERFAVEGVLLEESLCEWDGFAPAAFDGNFRKVQRSAKVLLCRGSVLIYLEGRFPAAGIEGRAMPGLSVRLVLRLKSASNALDSILRQYSPCGGQSDRITMASRSFGFSASAF